MIPIARAMTGLYDDFTHGRTDRESFEARLAALACGRSMAFLRRALGPRA